MTFGNYKDNILPQTNVVIRYKKLIRTNTLNPPMKN